jgi:outer membrane protein assembly factor BamB
VLNLKTTRIILLTAAVFSMTACSTISDWFSEEEEIEVRRLKPIDAQFTLEALWEHDVGNGVGNFYSRLQPAIAYGNVYVGSRQGDVYALDQDSGKVVWERNFATYSNQGFLSGLATLWSSGISAKIAGGMTVTANTVYFGTEDGFVYALNAESGETLWQIDVRGEVLAAPSVDAGIVVISTGAGSLIGLQVSDGSEAWRYDSDVPPLSLRGISSPVASNGGAIVGTAAGKLQVNIIDTGVVAWEAAVTTPSGATELERIVDIDSKPIIFGGNIYTISYDGTLAAVELRSGRVVWKREYSSYQSIALKGNALFVVDNNSNIYAIDRRNGVELWSQGRLKGRNLTGAAPMADYVVVGDQFGFLHWLDQQEGTLVARYQLGGDDEDEAIFSTPVVANETLYATTRDGVIAAVKVKP